MSTSRRAAATELVPQESFVVFDAVSIKKRAKLILVRVAAVMFFLVMDVLSHGFDLRFAD
jgi:hypothetical protein